jgi:hypothetical protein
MPAFAWHDRGHRETAYIAWDAMGSELREEVAQILRAHPRFEEDFRAHIPENIAAQGIAATNRWLLGQASIWPDLVQTLEDDLRREHNRSRWHYINFLVWLSEADAVALEAGLEHNRATDIEGPLDRGMNIVQALKGNLMIWHDADKSDAARAVALCWILHLTGDIHQPLHSVALFSESLFPGGDRGGNEIDVHWGDRTRNLHAVWDGLPTNMDDLSPSERTRQSIAEDDVSESAIDNWVRHHARLAEMFVYSESVREQLQAAAADGENRPVTLSHEYLVAARSIARRQVNLTGHRIPALLRH